MNRIFLIPFFILFFPGIALSQLEGNVPVALTASEKYISIKHEIERAIEKGNLYLKAQQSDGIWSSRDFPAMSALAITAYMRSPEAQVHPELPDYIRKGYDFILKSQKDNGGIFNRGLASYNTSVCMMALMAANKKEYTPALLKARAFLVNQQNHFAPDNPYNGGIGYGDKTSPPIADLSNSSLALEAIYYSRQLIQDGSYGEQPELDWEAAIDFITRCQEPESSNNEKKGGFHYRPVQTEKTESKNLNGENTPSNISRQKQETSVHAKDKKGRQEPEPAGAYGSMTYSGILSLIYANLDKNDPRIQMALKWLTKHYTLDENPGIGLQGLYYYYHAMSKTMAAARIDTLTLENGSIVDWRENLAKKLITTQRSDGSWVNTNNRWWESDPVLVTSYCVLALEQLYYSIPQQIN